MKLTWALRKRFWNPIAAIFLCCLMAPAATGIPITYVFSGPASGNLGASVFLGAQVTITAIADTANITTYAGFSSDLCMPLSSLIVNIAGIGSTTVTGSNLFLADLPSSEWTLENTNGGGCSPSIGSNWFGEDNPLAATYGLVTSLGPTTGTQPLVGSVNTTLGTLTFTTLPLTFQATLSTVFTADQSDLWYILAESGWGMQLVQRGTVIFATLFVYGPSGAPTWYVATMDYTANLTWTGDLYATTGPYFATVPFNPANVTATKVGTMTWAPESVANGMLTYVVNGTTVVKNVTRETLVPVDFSGHYAGSVHATVTGCPNAAANGTFDRMSILDIQQTATTIDIETEAVNAPNCTYEGVLTQAGQMGAVAGEFLCSDGSSGAVSFDELQVNRSGFTGTFSATYAVPLGCQSSGWLGGFRGTTF